MISLPAIKSHYSRIPESVRKFFLRGLLIFIAWKIAYILFLLPGRVLDKPLSDLTAWLSAKALSPFIDASVVYRGEIASVYIDGNSSVNIMDACNALVLFIIHLGFVVAWPAGVKDKLVYGIGGVFMILLLNVTRCAILAIISHKYLSIVDHHFVFNVVVYAFIFLLWHLYTKKSLNELA